MLRRLLPFSASILMLAACEKKKDAQPSAAETPSPFKTTPKVASAPTPQPTPTPIPPPTPEPTPYVPRKVLQTGSLFSGITYKTHFETLTGTTATQDRNSNDSYTVEVSVKVKIPKPHQKMEELRKLNDRLDTILPALGGMLEKAKVSPEFDQLYRLKTNLVRSNLDRLDQLPTRHNFYDCETILQLEHPTTKRRALLIQSDMDVDTDGSDGDRIFSLEGNQSSTYQPFTSYRWPKQTKVPNPCVPIWERRIAENDAKAKDPKTPAAEVARLKADSSRLRSEIKELQTFSFLMGAADPFIVLPTQWFSRGKTGYTPAIGDYCVVIVNDVLYPAIIGDAGPTSKMGEASLRICREVSAKASPSYRAIADLKATYLIFVGSSERPMVTPDLAKWTAKCEELLTDFGGHAGQLFKWEDITKSAVPPPPPPPIIPTTPPTVVPPTVAEGSATTPPAAANPTAAPVPAPAPAPAPAQADTNGATNGKTSP